MTMVPPNSDLGVLLYASWDGSGSFTGRDGQAGTVRTLTNSNWIASDWFQCGRFADLVFTVSGVISAGMASVQFIFERQRVDNYNGSLFKPAPVATTRTDTGNVANTQTITRAQLVGQNVSDWPAVAPAVEVIDVPLLTTNHRWAGRGRILLLATNAPQASDKIIVAANGGG